MLVSESIVVFKFDVIFAEAVRDFNLMLSLSFQKFEELGVACFQLFIVEDDKDFVSEG